MQVKMFTPLGKVLLFVGILVFWVIFTVIGYYIVPLFGVDPSFDRMLVVFFLSGLVSMVLGMFIVFMSGTVGDKFHENREG